MSSEHAYVLIGSGVAAAQVAESLLEAAPTTSILILEAGPRIEQRGRRSWWDLLTQGRTPYSSTYDREATDLAPESTSAADKWGFRESRVRAFGGSTMHWGGWALRYKPEDFKLYSRTKRGADWPFDYDELEPWYTAAEVGLSVGGGVHDPDPPRSTPYPLPAYPWTAHESILADAFSEHGLVPGHMPLARHARCVTTGTCKYCPVGARYTATEHLDSLLANPAHTGLKVMTEMTVLRILADAKRAYGVEVMNRATGQTQRIDAAYVIVCAGSYESPKLLLRSVSSFWPAGIGNSTDLVGRHLVTHNMLRVQGVTASNKEQWFQEYDFPTLMSRSWDTPERQASGKAFIFNNRGLPNTDIASLIASGASRKTVDAAVAGQRSAGLDAFIEEFGEPENRVMLGAGTGQFGLPTTVVQFRRAAEMKKVATQCMEDLLTILRTAGYERHPKPETAMMILEPRGDHSSGTCRLGLSEAESVVDGDLRVHGMDNLFICSNAVLPNAAAVNPTLTLCALALRLGAHLSDTSA
jgi:choline dehydrogenase-like flavoprotein